MYNYKSKRLTIERQNNYETTKNLPIAMKKKCRSTKETTTNQLLMDKEVFIKLRDIVFFIEQIINLHF